MLSMILFSGPKISFFMLATLNLSLMPIARLFLPRFVAASLAMMLSVVFARIAQFLTIVWMSRLGAVT